MNLIYKIKQRLKNGSVDDPTAEYFESPIGVTFGNVRHDDTPELSLKTIMDSLLNDAQFIYQGRTAPASKNVKVWYKTS